MEINNQNIKAIIFDMDGVIVDTEYWYQQRRQNFLKSLGYELNLEWQSFIGETFSSLWDQIKDDVDLPLEEIEQKYAKYKKENHIDYNGLLIPGIKPIIQFLHEKGYKLAVASSSTMKDIKQCLETNDLTEYFSVVNSARDLNDPKPSSLVYLQTLKDLKLQAHEVLAIEDSFAGITAAKNAKITTIAYQNPKYELDQSKADFQIVQPAQILTILEKKQKN